MSDKWRANKAWEDENLRGAWLPLKWTLRVFSSISLAVVLLVLVVLFGISASVPVGLIALAPTWGVYLLTLLGTVAVVGVVPALVVWQMTRGKGALRFVATFVVGLLLCGVGVVLWNAYAWPRLNYHPETGEGLRFFAGFVERNKNITLRRLPGMEMSELEYYGWWPLRVVLMLFVVNMVVATVRRIEFNVKNIGVLTVHTGIVTIALGSIYYHGLKREGDTLLLAGPVDAKTGVPGVGPAQDVFYDNTRVALYVNAGGGWEPKPLSGVPRYNDYNLGAIEATTALDVGLAATGFAKPWEVPSAGKLSVPVASAAGAEDVKLRLVGYAAYAEPQADWVKVEPDDTRGVSAGNSNTPLRIVYVHSDLPDDKGKVHEEPVYPFIVAPKVPVSRVANAAGNVLDVEYTLGAKHGMTDDRWRALSEVVPDGTRHALVVEIPAGDGQAEFRGVFPVDAGSEVTAGGYRLKVSQVSPEPPFPIITEGYKNAQSSVAVVRVTKPDGEKFDRYVYHRFPEINQDLYPDKLNARGMPTRKDADPAIRIYLVECDQLHVYIDEPGLGKTRAIVRQPGGRVRVVGEDEIDAKGADGTSGWIRDVVPKVSLRIGERWDEATRVERPTPVPPEKQDKQAIGTHEKAMLGVEVSVPRKGAASGESVFRRVVWVPFSRYMGLNNGGERTLILPDGRHMQLAFGRLMYQLPGFDVRLVDFKMLAYDNRGAPRDYQSVLRVEPTDGGFEGFDHVTKLNSPLKAPFMWSDERGLLANVGGTVLAGLNPNEFKFSQAGWDQAGWQRTQAQADAGMIPHPYASFTILGVGNNPGIHVIAFGGVLMGLGIPWAFYLKPYLVRREKKRIQREVAAGTFKKPVREAAPVGAGEGAGAGEVQEVGVS
ncbi:MAG: hypothetical protein GC200_08325 [Tepidisphaera sp.]|nr:hypothetical protein [Tepidisphaera sp.]